MQESNKYYNNFFMQVTNFVESLSRDGSSTY